DRYTVKFTDRPGTTEPPVVDRQIVRKIRAVVFDRARRRGTVLKEVEASRQDMPCLDEKQAVEVARMVRAISRSYGRPQDIEWVISGGRLMILQSRPITTLSRTADTSDVRRIWDNANIVESYGGVTTPLTFSFVQHVYTHVYQHFCRIMGVEEEVVSQNANCFKMLGLIEGRIYYNLYNWYKVLSLLPGYSINAAFMEQMMGVTERLEVPPSVVHSRRNKYLRVLQLIARTIANLMGLRGRIRRFHRLFNEILAPWEKHDFRELTPQELVDAYGSLERSLLARWQPPIVNDFFAMIFYGLLRNCTKKWHLDKTETLQNDLLCGEGGMISTEPVRSIQAIANAVCGDPTARELIRGATDEEIVGKVGLAEGTKSTEKLSWLSERISNHLERYGDRCVNELKLETITPRHDPVILIRLLRSYVLRGQVDLEEAHSREREVRLSAEQTVRRAMRWHPVRRAIFGFILRMTRETVKNRENLRFMRTRLFSIVRELFRGIGSRFYAENIIDDPGHIFYLTRQEIFDFIEGTSVSPNLRPLISQRLAAFTSYEKTSPADRFKSYGMVYHGNSFTGSRTAAVKGNALLSGTGCCPGVVTGKVRVVIDPNDAGDLEGCIMVAQRTDPGWASLFPLVNGMVIERGSLLSHSAIVAREMGIPAIVGVAGCMMMLKDGDMISIDGTTGSVTRTEAAASATANTGSTNDG
ncbi:MAG: hypothetical protein JXA18_11075, partial [Chitinispirillaceae bacterium]|nr:hypothetical protein [Chitinispirillaceae bacterium]